MDVYLPLPAHLYRGGQSMAINNSDDLKRDFKGDVIDDTDEESNDRDTNVDIDIDVNNVPGSMDGDALDTDEINAQSAEPSRPKINIKMPTDIEPKVANVMEKTYSTLYSLGMPTKEQKAKRDAKKKLRKKTSINEFVGLSKDDDEFLFGTEDEMLDMPTDEQIMGSKRTADYLTGYDLDKITGSSSIKKMTSIGDIDSIVGGSQKDIDDIIGTRTMHDTLDGEQKDIDDVLYVPDVDRLTGIDDTKELLSTDMNSILGTNTGNITSTKGVDEMLATGKVGLSKGEINDVIGTKSINKLLDSDASGLLDADTGSMLDTGADELLDTGVDELLDSDVDDMLNPDTSKMLDTNTDKMLNPDLSGMLSTDTHDIIHGKPKYKYGVVGPDGKVIRNKKTGKNSKNTNSGPSGYTPVSVGGTSTNSSINKHNKQRRE
jgi:hypothetical protein